MAEIDTEEILRQIDRFEMSHGTLSPLQAEVELGGILKRLFEADGYQMEHTGPVRDGGVDYTAQKEGAEKIAVEFKHYRNGNAVGLQVVHQLMGVAIAGGYQRAILLARTSFTKVAMEALQRDLPLEFLLMNVDSLRAWTHRLERLKTVEPSLVVQAVAELSRALARLVAKNPRYLDEIEWRDMERLLAEMFSRFGFDVELTPGAKDGGKDIVLRCLVGGQGKTYLVEVKHWRSLQKVGVKKLRQFVKVVAAEQAERGLFVSTYGYASEAIEALTEIEKQRINFGQESKVASLCKLFVRAESGLWSPPDALPEVLFEDTL